MANAGFEPWVEKYRPHKLKDIVGHKHIVDRLEHFTKTKSLPNMLFAGRAGIGKTTAALALARELYGEDLSSCFAELNASVTPETPILIRVRGKVKRTNFAWLASHYFGDNKSKYCYPQDLEVLSLDRNTYLPCFKSVSNISRHTVNKVVKIRYEGGEVRTSLDHSLMVLNEKGELETKAAGELQRGDLLVSFTSASEGNRILLDFESFLPKDFQGRQNPKVKTQIQNKLLDESLAWLFGLYTAEGCIYLNSRDTSGVTIFTVAYPQEDDVAIDTSLVLKDEFNLNSRNIISPSGFDHSKYSSIQVRVCNTQLAKFFLQNFYDATASELGANALTKRTPDFIFSAPLEQKIEFLKGYSGDACGSWGSLLRYSSVSQENLIDTVWLARLCGIDSSLYHREARLVWRLPSYSYLHSDLISFVPVKRVLNELSKENWRYQLRHQLYSKKSKRISKKTALGFLAGLNQTTSVASLKKLLESPLYSISITDVEIEPYSGFVYDVSVPGAEVFWGGTAPILLHNSDERGIDVVRGKIKDFARTLPIASVDFKIILLDEADALTPDAQQALRRTMESYSKNCRFILSCNYSSRIIEPIQSRCAVFRFRSLENEDIKKITEEIAKNEGVGIDAKGLDAIVYIAEGDARKAINCLQGSSEKGKVTEESVFEVSSRARPKEIAEMVSLALKGKFGEARALLNTMMVKYAMSGEDVMDQVYREVISLPISDDVKVQLVDKIGEYDFRMSQGADERIQLEALLAQIMLFGKK